MQSDKTNAVSSQHERSLIDAAIAGDDERRRQAHHTVRGIDLAVVIENEREGQAELSGIPMDRCSLFASIDANDGEPFRGELAVKPFEHGHLRATLCTPARPEVDKDHLAAEILDREPARVDRAPAEVRRGGSGGVAGEIEWLEKRRHRRFGSREAARRGDEQRLADINNALRDDGVRAVFATLALVTFQRYVVQRTYSSVIKADALHFVSDLATNLATLAALLFAARGYNRLDPIFGLVIAALTGQDPARILQLVGLVQEVTQQNAPPPESAGPPADNLGKFASVVIASTEDEWTKILSPSAQWGMLVHKDEGDDKDGVTEGTWGCHLKQKTFVFVRPRAGTSIVSSLTSSTSTVTPAIGGPGGQRTYSSCETT